MASIITATLTLESTQELAQARTDLMLRQRRMIAEASARAKGRELPPQEEPIPVVKEATKHKATAGLGSFLQKSNRKTAYTSGEFTVTTIDSENEHVLDRVEAALELQQERVDSVREEVQAQQELAQVRYMARDKAGATSAMRTARYLQAALAQEEAYANKLAQLEKQVHDNSNGDDKDVLETLHQIVASAQDARAHFQSSGDVKVGDDLLLQEIRNSIKKL